MAWKRAYRRAWVPLLRKEHLMGARLFHRPNRPGWHSWNATTRREGFDRVWECRCGATTTATFPTGNPTLADGEASGWPLDVYDTVSHLMDEPE